MHFRGNSPSFWDSYLSPYLKFKINRDLRIIESAKTGGLDNKTLFTQVDEQLDDGSYLRRLDFAKLASLEEATDFYGKITNVNTVWPANQDAWRENPTELAKQVSLVDFNVVLNMAIDWASDNNVQFFAEIVPVDYEGTDPNTGLSVPGGRRFADGVVIVGESFYPETAPEVEFPE